MIRIFSSKTLRPLSLNASASKLISASFHALLGFYASNPRPSDAERTQTPTHFIPGSHGNTISDLVCSMLKLGSAWDSTLESALKNLCISGELTPLQAMDVITRLNNPELALKFFKFTKTQLGVEHCSNTYNILIAELSHMGQFEAAKEILEDMKNSSNFPPSSIFMALVTCLARAGRIDEALAVFKRAEDFNCKLSVVWYNNILNILINRNIPNEKILGFFRHRLCQNVCPDSTSFNIVIKGLCRAGNVDEGFELLHEMGNYGCVPDVVTFNTLINGLCRVSRVEDAYRVLREMRSCKSCRPNVVSYTSIISGYCRSGLLDEAVRILNEMLESGERPNLVTSNVLVDGFCKAGDMEKAEALFGKMADRDVVSYTSMIDGYCKAGKTDESMRLFLEMKVRGMEPNVYTYAVMINGLCKENRLNVAFGLMERMRESGVLGRTFIYNPVIDGFCKAGNVDQANQIFKQMRGGGCHPDKITYTILLYGHCMKGRMSEAISLFYEMPHMGCDPDYVTVKALVSCLLKASMPAKAKSILLSVLFKAASQTNPLVI